MKKRKRGKMKNKTIIKIISITALITIVMCFLNENIYAKEFSINKADLYSKGNCKSLLINIPTGGTIIVSKVFYKNGGKEYPAYCLNKELDGVGKVEGYSVSVDKIIDNELVRKVIINGYPYKSLESLGVKDIDEAFTATKMAVYCVLYDYDIDKKFKPIGEAGDRTLNAIKKIVNNAKESSESYKNPNIDIKELEEKWNVDEIDKSYISKTFQIVSDIDVNEVNVELENTKIKDIKITDLENNEKNSFNNNVKFKILIPIDKLEEDGNFIININANLDTKPILYGKAPNSNVQNYALTGISYEITSKNKEVEYPKNPTTVTIEKISYETNNKLDGAMFNVYDKNKDIIYENITVDENGLVTIEGILPGKYYIEEIKAPEGYEKSEKLIEFNIEYGEEKLISITNNKINITTREVSEKKLPKTGF